MGGGGRGPWGLGLLPMSVDARCGEGLVLADGHEGESGVFRVHHLGGALKIVDRV